MDPIFEVEVKYALPDATSLQRAVEDRGGSFSDPVSQRDTYYAHPQRNFADTDEALRIRRIGDEARITYKGPKIDTTTKTRRELEIPLLAGDNHAALLELLSFREVATVDKTRRTAELEFEGWHFEVCWDQVDGVGSFAEIETTAKEEQLAEARGSLQRLASELGLTDAELRGYLDLLLAGPK